MEYLDIIITCVILVLVVICFRKFSSFVYAFAAIDIFLRLVDFVATNLPVPNIQTFLDKTFPNSILSIVCTHTDGIIETILIWLCFFTYCVFLGYVIRTFFRKKW